jgi:DNA mismatch repair ATPase MutL
MFVFDPLGKVESVSKATLTVGTIVTASCLFSRMPVRRAIYDKISRKREELKKIETVCAAIALARPNVRIEVGKLSASTI